EVQVLVAGQRAGQQVGLAEDLEPVADPQNRQPFARSFDDRLHGRREPGDRAAAQVVAVREAAGEDHRVDAAQVGIVVPQRAIPAPGQADRAARVAVVERTGERDDPDPHWAPSSTRTVKSSITGLASRRSAISWARCRSGPSANSISIRLPIRTDSTPATP